MTNKLLVYFFLFLSFYVLLYNPQIDTLITSNIFFPLGLRMVKVFKITTNVHNARNFKTPPYGLLCGIKLYMTASYLFPL